MLRLEDYAAQVRAEAAPRNVNLITGASGTTDIEGVLTRGAHGPRKLISWFTAEQRRQVSETDDSCPTTLRRAARFKDGRDELRATLWRI